MCEVLVYLRELYHLSPPSGLINQRSFFLEERVNQWKCEEMPRSVVLRQCCFYGAGAAAVFLWHAAPVRGKDRTKNDSLAIANRTLLGTSASLLVTSALLLVTIRI